MKTVDKVTDKITRRDFLSLGCATVGVLVLTAGASVPVRAEKKEEDGSVDAIIKTFSGGKVPQSGRVALLTPEIAENGNTVPVSFEVESPMTQEDYVQSVLLLADGNPRPGVATMHFSPLSGAASATTRIRLAKTQHIVAVAKMKDGSVFIDKKKVKVTIGGCGG